MGVVKVVRRFCHYSMIGSALIVCVGCATQPAESTSNGYLVQSRDLEQQAQSGNGERLAKPVPERPVLVNNSLVFAVPGNAVLGIAMSVGAIKTTVASLETMAEFDLVALVQAEVADLSKAPPMPITLEPYCYLYGHPNAYVEARLRVVNAGVDRTLKERSEKHPITGELSWSADGGQLLIDACSSRVVGLVKRLTNELESL